MFVYVTCVCSDNTICVLVPTLQCNSSMSTGGGVYLSWTVAYNGGRNVTSIQIEYTLAASTQHYQPIDALVTSSATSVLVMQQFVASRSYLFQISANNSIGSSNVVRGPVLIKEGFLGLLEIKTQYNISLTFRNSSST